MAYGGGLLVLRGSEGPEFLLRPREAVERGGPHTGSGNKPGDRAGLPVCVARSKHLVPSDLS